MSLPLPPAEPLSAFVARARDLYTLPAVALQVLELTASPQVDPRAVKNCIENDPALAARLLRVVNSSLFGLSRQVSDLNQALALLGVKPLKLLVLGFSLPKTLFEGLQTDMLAAYWRRTLTKAAAARAFAAYAWPRGSDEALIGGLLQDIGLLALVQDLGEPYVAFLDRVRREDGDLAMRELETLGFDHAMLSARLLDAWGLPAGLAWAIAQRQQVEHLATLPEASRRLPHTLHLAELSARVLADERPAALHELEVAGWQYARLAPERIAGLLGELEHDIMLLAEALDLELRDPPDPEPLLAAAQTRRIAVADAAQRELQQAAAETRLWQEAASLRRAVASFCDRQNESATRGSGSAAALRRERQGPSESPATASSRPALPTTWDVPTLGGEAVVPMRSAASSPWRPDDSAHLGRIDAAVSRCRQRRVAASLLAIALDREEQIAFAGGAEGVRRALRLVVDAVELFWDQDESCWEMDPTCVAAMLESCDRSQAVSLARRLVDAIPAQSLRPPVQLLQPVTLSVGVATLALPPRNFPPRELWEAAWRCLSAARASGGNVVKSIDIY